MAQSPNCLGPPGDHDDLAGDRCGPSRDQLRLQTSSIGIANRVIDDIDQVDAMPKRMQSTEVLGPQEFNSLLNHRLMLM
jgi:hypothetical protein